VRAGDHTGTARLIEALRGRDPAEVESLQARRPRDLRDSRDLLERGTAKIQLEFEELEHYPGALPAEDAAYVRAVLAEAASYTGEDVKDVASRLLLVKRRLADARRGVAGRIVKQLAEGAAIAAQRAGDGAVGGWAEADVGRVRAFIDQDDLGSAQEALSILERDGRLPAEVGTSGTALLRAFWPARVDAAAAPDFVAGAVEVLRAGGELTGVRTRAVGPRPPPLACRGVDGMAGAGREEAVHGRLGRAGMAGTR
jgi:hypothetical protein